MTRQNAIDAIKHADPDFLERSPKNRKAYICPTCGSGSDHGDGITRSAKDRYTCWSGQCLGDGDHPSGDMFNLIGITFGLSTFKEQLEKGCELFGITIDDKGASQKPFSKGEREAEPEPDYRDYLNNAQLNLTKDGVGADYLARRGIPFDVAKRMRLGFDPAWRHPKCPYHPATPRIIVPIGPYGHAYTTRDIRPSDLIQADEDAYKGFKGKMSVSSGLFGISQLEASPVFATEGWADALSIIAAGEKAVATNSTAWTKWLIRELKAMKEAGKRLPKIIDAFDHDKAGRECAAKLKTQLAKLGVEFHPANIVPTGCKDPNDAWIKDRNAFTIALQIARQDAQEIELPLPDIELDKEKAGPTSEEISKAALLERAGNLWADHRLPSFDTYITGNVDRQKIRTGFKRLDDFFGGGLYPGLIALGGPTGTGKTNFALQMADHIASSGIPVLYVALEMSAHELIARSISRITGEMIGDSQFSGGIPCIDILNGKTEYDGSHDVWEIARKRYAESIAPNMAIMEGLADIDAGHVREMANAVQELRGQAPVVIVDYLQIMAIHEPHMTERQATDYNVIGLKRLSRDFDIPVMILSAFNRETVKNKDQSPDLTAFRESSCIEYTCDIAMTMQDMTPDGNIAAEVKDIGLGILKNRRGPTLPRGSAMPFDFYGMTSRFCESVRDLSPRGKEKDLNLDGFDQDLIDYFGNDLNLNCVIEI